MTRRVLTIATAAVALAIGPNSLPAGSEAKAPARCADDPGWSDPARPRKIFGNTWYVGTCGISALLVTGKRGHVLIDAGTAKAAPLVEANIRALGFRVRDIRAIVASHSHEDHVGGLAHLQRASGATVYTLKPAASTLTTGQIGKDDPQFGVTTRFPAVKAPRTIADRAVVGVGELELTAHATPGHTLGGTSWTWRSCEGAQCREIAYVDSLTAVSNATYRFSDDAAHPGVLADFRRTLDRIASLPCDILVTPHPGASDLWARLPPDATKPLADRGACREYARTARIRLAARVAKEAQP